MPAARSNPSPDPATLALDALAWLLADPARAARFLELTGLTPHALRAGASAPATMAATLRFLLAHEPDLVACADALGVPAPAFALAAERLDPQG